MPSIWSGFLALLLFLPLLALLAWVEARWGDEDGIDVRPPRRRRR